jgi:hemolysin III
MTSYSYTAKYRPVIAETAEIEHNFRFRAKEPGSALTHLIGFIAAIFGTPALLIHASMHGASFLNQISLSIFMLSMILLYGASTVYHSFDVSERVNRVLRKIDHMMIFILIAGSYTPVCLIGIGGAVGTRLLALVWGIAIFGLVLKACWITCPKWFSSVIYIGMGWVCLLAFPQIVANLSVGAFAWLLAGGLIYTIGGIIYALKLPLFNSLFKNFGSHELFHVFVMGGSFCHFMMMYQYLALM